MNLVLADKREAQSLANTGVESFVAHLEGLPKTRRVQVERAQLLPMNLSGEETADDFVGSRVERLDGWLRRALGYGLNGPEPG